MSLALTFASLSSFKRNLFVARYTVLTDVDAALLMGFHLVSNVSGSLDLESLDFWENHLKKCWQIVSTEY